MGAVEHLESLKGHSARNDASLLIPRTFYLNLDLISRPWRQGESVKTQVDLH